MQRTPPVERPTLGVTARTQSLPPSDRLTRAGAPIHVALAPTVEDEPPIEMRPSRTKDREPAREITTPTVIGRDVELRAIDGFLGRVPGGPAALVFEGAPGIGTGSAPRPAGSRAAERPRARDAAARPAAAACARRPARAGRNLLSELIEAKVGIGQLDEAAALLDPYAEQVQRLPLIVVLTSVTQQVHRRPKARRDAPSPRIPPP